MLHAVRGEGESALPPLTLSCIVERKRAETPQDHRPFLDLVSGRPGYFEPSPLMYATSSLI